MLSCQNRGKGYGVTKNDQNNLSTFTRVINKQEYKFKDGNLIIKKLKRKTSLIKSR